MSPVDTEPPASGPPITERPTPTSATDTRTGVGDAAPDRTAGQEARAARRRLARARRERRRYERGEVRRFTSRVRRRRWAWGVSVAAVLALVVFVVAGANSPLMALRTVQVEGTQRIDPVAVRDALSDHLGRPLPSVDAAAVTADLEAFPLIRSFSLESRPPDTLVVRVVERVPIGVIGAPGGFQLIDGAGVVIETSPERPAGYPLVETSGTVDDAPFRAASAVLRTLPEGMAATIDRIGATTADDVSFSLAGTSQMVVWGSAEDAAYKALVLSKLLATQDPAVPATIDVSSPDTPIVRA